MKIRNYGLEQIEALIVEGTDLLVITSPASFDKNTLSRLSEQIESIRDSDWRTSLILADINTDIESLCHEIIEQALPDGVEDTLPIVSQVHKYLEYSAHNALMPVIMVEDAHKLSLEVLEFILQLAELRYAESLFRIVLFADETINEHLDVPKLRNLTTVVLHNIHTTSFSQEETKESVDNEISTFDEIDEYLIADEDALENTEEETSRSLVTLSVIAIGLISVFFIYLYLNDQKDGGITGSSIATQLQQVPPEKIHDQGEHMVPLEQVVTLEEDVQEIEEQNQFMDKDDSIIDNQLSQIQIVSEPSIEEESYENILDIEITEAEEITKILYEELPEYVEEIESPVVEEVLMPEIDNENVFNLETVPDIVAGIKGPAWLRQQPANSYVLQLLSARYMSNIKNLLSGQPGIQDNLSGYVKYTPSGKPRYLLLYGFYPDRKTAEAAINELPVELQLVNPWPRKLGDAIKEINKISEPLIDDELSESILGLG